MKSRAGIYYAPAEIWRIRIVLTGGKLSWEAGGRPGVEMTPVSATRFVVPQPEGTWELEFLPAASGAPQQMQTRVPPSHDEVVWERVEAFAPSSAEMRAFVGQYASAELGIVYTVRQGESALLLREGRRGEEVLYPKFTDAFNSDDTQLLRFTRDASGAITGFVLSWGRVRGVRFEKIGK